MAAPQTYTGNGLTVTIADPENITKDECLQLARAGKEAWNSWRQSFGTNGGLNVADFQDADFRQTYVDFSGFELGKGAKFIQARFSKGVRFTGAQFDGSPNFVRAEFDGYANFDKAQFGDNASFDGAKFGPQGSFDGAQFGKWAIFSGALFGNGVNFAAAQFNDWAKFENVRFEGWAIFYGAQFGSGASFDNAQFVERASFEASQWGKLNHYYGVEFLVRKAWAEKCGLDPTTFSSISFNGASFGGEANFENRQFLSAASFTGANGKPTRFTKAPLFHGCKFHQDTSFDGAEYPEATGDEAAARAYRTLKLAFAQQQAIREEQRFFKLEMQEEAVGEKGWKRWLYRAYGYFSDFGFSIWRPLKRLVLWPALGFALFYQGLMLFHHTSLQTSPLMDHPALLSQWLQFTLANLAPLPDSGLLKDLRSALFGDGSQSSLITVAAMGLETLQKPLALVAYFLMGLALRNLFKMK